MKVVFLVKVPRWYSFRGDRLTRLLQQRGHAVTDIIVEPVNPAGFLREQDRKLGFFVLGRKLARAALSLLRAAARFSPTTPATPRVHIVKSHNSPECERLLQSIAPDVIFLRGCGILQASILATARIGVLNAHYGELPKYRGVYATEWSVLHGDRPMVTIHFVDAGVDSGRVLATLPVPMEHGATLASLRDASSRLGADLLLHVLDGLESGTLEPREQPAGQALQYFSMHPRIYAVAERRLQRAVAR